MHQKQEHRIGCAEVTHGAVAHLLPIGIFQGSNTSRETFILEVAKAMSFLGSRDIIGVGFRITASNPATHPPDTCFQIVCGTQQSVVGGFIKMRVDLSVWEFRAEPNSSDGLPVMPFKVHKK